jgi:hypothetical protein
MNTAASAEERTRIARGHDVGREAGALAQDDTSIKADLTIHADQPQWTIDRRIYGQFAEHLGHGIYGGLWVGEDSSIPNTRGLRKDVISALKNLKVPVVRWPGGCFADEYHWRAGIGPREQRPVSVKPTGAMLPTPTPSARTNSWT